MTGLSDKDLSFFENNHAPAPKTARASAKTSSGSSPGMKNSDLLIGLFTAAPGASTTGPSISGVANVTPMDSRASAVPMSFGSNNSSNSSFSIAQTDSISSTATATATSVATDNDDDEFGDFVDSNSNSGSPLTASVVHTNSASGSQPAPASLFASPISSFTSDSNTTSLNITHNAVSVSGDSVRAIQKESTTDNISSHNSEQQLPTSITHDSASHGSLINSTTSAIPLKSADGSPMILSTTTPPPPAPLAKEERNQEASARAENVPGPFEKVPASTELITLFNDIVLHFVDQLFKKLVPLPYALKKRVLANIATKKFLDGYLATIQVGIMVLEGRYRRLQRDGPGKVPGSMGPVHQDPECERAAREFVRVWTAEIVPRLRTAGLRPVELTRVPAGVVSITPTSTTTAPSSSPPSQPTCAVCGLARDEQPSVYLLPRSMRWEETSGPGHLTCLRFWAHRDIYGITV